MKTNRWMLGVFVVGLCCLGLGCGPTTSRNSADSQAQGEAHHDHGHDGGNALGFAESVKQLAKYRDEIQAAFAQGKPDTCDDALHHAFEIVERLPEAAADSDMSRDDWAKVKEDATKLSVQLMKIHEGFHGDAKGATFDEVSVELDAALEGLKAKLPAAPATPPTSEESAGPVQTSDPAQPSGTEQPAVTEEQQP